MTCVGGSWNFHDCFESRFNQGSDHCVAILYHDQGVTKYNTKKQQHLTTRKYEFSPPQAKWIVFSPKLIQSECNLHLCDRYIPYQLSFENGLPQYSFAHPYVDQSCESAPRAFLIWFFELCIQTQRALNLSHWTSHSHLDQWCRKSAERKVGGRKKQVNQLYKNILQPQVNTVNVIRYNLNIVSLW